MGADDGQRSMPRRCGQPLTARVDHLFTERISVPPGPFDPAPAGGLHEFARRRHYGGRRKGVIT